MADNITLNSGSGGATLAADDISSVWYQRIKLVASADGSTAELSKAEDAAHSTGDHGFMFLAVRNDTLAALAGTDGDYAPIQVNASGAVYAEISSALPAGTNAIGKLAANDGVDIGDVDVTSIVPGTAATSLGKAEDAVHATGDTGIMPLGVRNDTLAALAGTDGDYAPLQVNASGALYAQIAGQDADITIADGGNAITVDWAGTAPPIGAGVEATALRVTLATDSTGVVSIDDNGSTLSVDDGAGALTVDWNGTAPPIGAGVEATALRVTLATDSTGVLSVDDNGATLSVDDGAGSLTIDGTVTASNTAGDVAHDSADSGNPVKTGGIAHDEDPALVANNDRVNAYHDLAGRYVGSMCPLEEIVSGTNNATTTADTQIIAAQGAGFRIYVTSVAVSNESATDTAVILKSAANVLYRLPAPATSDTGGGCIQTFNPPLRCNANEALNFAAAAGVITMHVSAVGFKAR